MHNTIKAKVRFCNEPKGKGGVCGVLLDVTLSKRGEEEEEKEESYWFEPRHG